VDSREIYRLLSSALADEMKERGFQRVKGTFPAWTKQVEGKYATVWFQAARAGGEFTIELHHSSKPEPGTAKWNERYRFFALLDEVEREELPRALPQGSMTTATDYWFRARSPSDVEAVAGWFKGMVEALIARVVSRTSSSTGNTVIEP
jgi:hypothetical protein